MAGESRGWLQHPVGPSSPRIAGVSGKRFNVASLAFSEERIEARLDFLTGDTCNDGNFLLECAVKFLRLWIWPNDLNELIH